MKKQKGHAKIRVEKRLVKIALLSLAMIYLRKPRTGQNISDFMDWYLVDDVNYKYGFNISL